LLGFILPVFILFTAMFSVSTAYLRSGVFCIEGGTVLGFPAPIFVQCYGAIIPGDGQSVGLAQFYASGLVVDLVFWYAVSLVLWMIGLRILARFRGGGRPQNQDS
jgi:uncharacterized membrane protein YczE